MKISTEVLTVLDECRCESNTLMLPPRQLDRSLYLAVNKVLEAAGGKWNRKAKAHLFAEEAAGKIEQMILTGEILDKKQELGFFETPVSLAGLMCHRAGVTPHNSVARKGIKALEPSAGSGRIVNALRAHGASVSAIEIDKAMAGQLDYLMQPLGECRCEDFLCVEPRADFDVVAMNPPFAKQADIDHVTHAVGFLKPGGILVAIMSAGIKFRGNRKAVEFRRLLAGASFEDLPAGTFKESGTMVNTVLVHYHKPSC